MVSFVKAALTLGIIALLINFTWMKRVRFEAKKPRTSPTPATLLGHATITSHRLFLVVDPAHARVSLDATLLDLDPRGIPRPDDGTEHELWVTAPGYRPERRLVRFNADQRLSIALSPLASAPSTSMQNPPRKRAGAPQALPSVSTAPPDNLAASRGLDHENPY